MLESGLSRTPPPSGLVRSPQTKTASVLDRGWIGDGFNETCSLTFISLCDSRIPGGQVERSPDSGTRHVRANQHDGQSNTKLKIRFFRYKMKCSTSQLGLDPGPDHSEVCRFCMLLSGLPRYSGCTNLSLFHPQGWRPQDRVLQELAARPDHFCGGSRGEGQSRGVAHRLWRHCQRYFGT